MHIFPVEPDWREDGKPLVHISFYAVRLNLGSQYPLEFTFLFSVLAQNTRFPVPHPPVLKEWGEIRRNSLYFRDISLSATDFILTLEHLSLNIPHQNYRHFQFTYLFRAYTSSVF